MFKKPLKIPSRWVLIVVTLLILSILATRQSIHLLLIEDVRRERPVFAARIKPGDQISMGFLHSVENCHVWDHLTVDAQYELVVVSTDFSESRTGLPYAAFEGEIFERWKDGFRISNMNRPVPEIYQWVDAKYENTMTLNDDKVISLASLAGNTLLHVHVSRVNLPEWILIKARLF